MSIRIPLCAFLLLLGLTPVLFAERPNLDREMLDAESTHILVGDVKAVYSRDVRTELRGEVTVKTHYLVEIEVDAVAKGEYGPTLQEDNGMTAVYPNGFQVLPQPPQPNR